MNKHYVCTGGCHGMSEMPGVCKAPDCAKHGEALMECKCHDGGHENVMKCKNCGNPATAESQTLDDGSKICADGKCAIEPSKPELSA